MQHITISYPKDNILPPPNFGKDCQSAYGLLCIFSFFLRIGGLGFTCAHAVVMARLVVSTLDHGVYPFIVQLCSLEDHTLLLGTEAGDVGSKLGYSEVDTSYCALFRVQIPRAHMQSDTSRIDRDRTYHRGSQ